MGVLVGLDNEQFKLLMKMSSLSYGVSSRLCGGVVAHKILLSAPVPWIGNWGPGLDNKVSDEQIFTVDMLSVPRL